MSFQCTQSLCFKYVLAALLLWNCRVLSQTSDDMKNLVTTLFTTNSYNKIVRPKYNHADPLVVFVSFHLVGIMDIDEVSEKMTTTAVLELAWDDYYLRWNSSDYGGIASIYVPQKDIWKPDIALQNGFTKMKELGEDEIVATISSDGVVYWFPYEVFETTCSINIEYFPFDGQTCILEFGVWTYPLSLVEVVVGSKGLELDMYQKNGEWDITKTSTSSRQSSTDGAIVNFAIELKRKPEYYLFNVVAPILLLSVLAVFTFILPVDSGEKMGFCMTVYLAFAVFLTIVSASLPVSSTQSVLSRYLIFLVVVGTLVVMITAIEVRLHFRDASREISGCLKSLVRVSRKLQCRKLDQSICDESRVFVKVETDFNKDKNADQNTNIRNSDNKPQAISPPEVTDDGITWSDVTAAIDFYCFWLFLIINVAGTVAIFGIGYIKSQG